VRTITQYATCSFIDKDPIVDTMRTIFEREGESYRSINEMSGDSISTLNNWFNGDTKRPQFATVMAVARSLGYDMDLVKLGKVAGRSFRFKPVGEATCAQSLSQKAIAGWPHASSITLGQLRDGVTELGPGPKRKAA
jgi:transcriptional regulator with XRE-family HTH domain